MPNGLDFVGTVPHTLTPRELDLVLKVTGEHVAGWRDHMLIAMAVGTALRQHELVALDIRDVVSETGGIRRRVRLRTFKRSNRDLDAQEIVLAKTLRAKLERYLAHRARQAPLAPDAPLFLSRLGKRLSTRQVRTLFARWQVRAGLDRHLPFHSTRHTGITNVYRLTKDLLVAAKYARHRSALYTQRYAHAADEDLERAVDQVRC